MRRLVSLGFAALIGGCGAVFHPSGPAADSALLPRDAFGPGAPASVEDSPVHYTGESLRVSAERLPARRGDAFYIAYRLNGPNASLVLVVADRASGVTVRPSPFSEWAQTTAYGRFADDSGPFRYTTFETDVTRCLWFERLGEDDPAVWGAYCVGVDAPPPSAIRNKILRGVAVRALVDPPSTPAGAETAPDGAADESPPGAPSPDGDTAAGTPPERDARAAPQMSPPEDEPPAPEDTPLAPDDAPPAPEPTPAEAAADTPPAAGEPVDDGPSDGGPAQDAPSPDEQDAATE